MNEPRPSLSPWIDWARGQADREGISQNHIVGRMRVLNEAVEPKISDSKVAQCNRAIAALPDIMRKTIVCAYLTDGTHAQKARWLGMSKAAYERKLARALATAGL